MRALLPDNERDRLAALYRYGVLDTPPEASFDRLTRLVSRAFKVPVSLITLVDRDRQFFKSANGGGEFDTVTILRGFFKSHLGKNFQESPREYSLCSHAILNDDITLACDTTADIRFADNPMVVNEPHVRFYAAAPLKTRDGFPLGTICALDVEPRRVPDPSLMDLLRDLADEVMEQMEMRWLKRRFATQSQHLESSRESIQKAQQRAMQALEAGHMGYWERDPDTDLITFSPVLEQMLGLDHDRYDGSVDGWLRHVHPDDRPMIISRITQARRDGKNYTFRYRPLTKDGSERWITTTGTYFQDSTGAFAGGHGVSWDSTESEASARRLKMSEELFRVLSNAAPIGIFRTDTEGNLTYANSTLAAYNGVPESELLGNGWIRRIHPDDRHQLLTLIATPALETRENEHRLLLPDGSVRWVRARTSVLRDQRGTPLGKVGTVDDITQQRQMMLDLTQAKETAEVASRAKDMFLANVSHELRTPLNGVLGMSELLVDCGLHSEQQEMAEIVRDSARGLLSVVNDMLDLSRIEAGRLTIDCLPFRLRLAIQQTLSLFKAEARKKGLSLLLDCAEDLPDAYRGDEGRIRQILINYLSNAIKFTSAGQVIIKATGAITANEVELLLAVCDSGPGISADAQKKLFQPFSQVDSSSTRRNGGVGLGLAISRRLAELMHGSVGVDSSPGEGSTFWLRLPLVPDERPTGAIDPQPAGSPRETAQDARVLLVEDNPVNQKVAVGVLRRLGWEADVADNGLTALDLYRAHDYAVILMDCQMPEMDGYEATGQIRIWEKAQGRPNVPILALTAHAMSGDKERCLAAGMNDYLSKPLALEELRSALDRWAVLN